MAGVTRAVGTEGGKEGKGEGGERGGEEGGGEEGGGEKGGGKEILADGTGRDGTGPIEVVQEVLAELKSFNDKTPPKTRTVFKLHPAPPMDNVHRRHFYGDHPPY